MWEMPDMSLIMGNELMAGDSFASLPQNGNDAAALLDARWRKERHEAVRKIIEDGMTTLGTSMGQFQKSLEILYSKFSEMEGFTTCETPDPDRLYVINGKVGRLVSPQDQ